MYLDKRNSSCDTGQEVWGGKNQKIKNKEHQKILYNEEIRVAMIVNIGLSTDLSKKLINIHKLCFLFLLIELFFLPDYNSANAVVSAFANSFVCYFVSTGIMTVIRRKEEANVVCNVCLQRFYF